MSIDENTIEFWKQKYEELSIQFDEYQKSSRDFEIELENELKQREDENTSLKSRNSRLQTDNENLKTKMSEINVATHKQISTLQEELSKTKSIREEMQKYIRELEQKNDDLERTNRCAMFSLGEFESKLNEALERNAILESELDEKDELAETVQRLRDEARDLKQEMTVRQLKSQKREDLKAHHSMCMETLEQGNQSDQIEKIASIAAAAVAANSQPQQNEANQMISDDITDVNMQQQQQQQQKSVTNGHHMHSHPLTPSVRANALNLVGDALRKVTSMEGRLIAARNQMKESNRDRRSTTTTISIDSTR